MDISSLCGRIRKGRALSDAEETWLSFGKSLYWVLAVVKKQLYDVEEASEPLWASVSPFMYFTHH